MAERQRPKRGRPPRVLIAGLGNLLLRDDGVGVQAVRLLQAKPPSGVLVAEVGTQVLGALHLLEWADRVLALDALMAGGPPGTIYACRESDVALEAVQASLHELGLRAALHFLPRERRPEVFILGLEPASLEPGLELSPPVQAALPRFLELARDSAARLRGW
ncbi:MAG: hydrogenase maturation protease [Desulfobaccales bacterium]